MAHPPRRPRRSDGDCSDLLATLTSACIIGEPNGYIVIYNETDEQIEVRYRDQVIGEVAPDTSENFNPRPAHDVDCLIGPLEVLNADGQVIDQVDAGRCYGRVIEVRIADDP